MKLNKVMLIGNLTGDPEIRHTKSGKAVASFSLALNRSYTAQPSGEKREETTYIDIVMWDRQAELCEQYLKKGRGILVEGRLQEDSWQDKKTGENRKKIRVVGDRLEFMPDKNADAREPEMAQG
jgi:single-strand DNA-binding protein